MNPVSTDTTSTNRPQKRGALPGIAKGAASSLLATGVITVLSVMLTGLRGCHDREKPMVQYELRRQGGGPLLPDCEVFADGRGTLGTSSAGGVIRVHPAHAPAEGDQVHVLCEGRLVGTGVATGSQIIVVPRKSSAMTDPRAGE